MGKWACCPMIVQQCAQEQNGEQINEINDQVITLCFSTNLSRLLRGGDFKRYRVMNEDIIEIDFYWTADINGR